MSKPRLVVIGGGAGGAVAVAEPRKDGFDGGVTLVSAENTVPYERPPLSNEFLLGAPAADGAVEDAAWYEQHPGLDVPQAGVTPADAGAGRS